MMITRIEVIGCGAAFIDYDNDGWPDMFVVTGSVYPEVDDPDRR